MKTSRQLIDLLRNTSQPLGQKAIKQIADRLDAFDKLSLQVERHNAMHEKFCQEVGAGDNLYEYVLKLKDSLK